MKPSVSFGLYVFVVIALAACDRNTAIIPQNTPSPAPQTSADSGSAKLSETTAERSKEERLTELAKGLADLLDRPMEEVDLPSEVLEAWSAHAPGSREHFFKLKVPQSSAQDWRNAMIQVEPDDQEYLLPPGDAARWWVPPGIFSRLEFYSSETIVGKSYGWVGLDSSNGEVYIFARK